MLIRVLKQGEFIPAGGATAFLTLKITPVNGQMWRGVSSNQAIITRGRLITQGTGFTSVQPRQNMHATFGSPTGLEANVGSAITGTSIVQGTSYFMPYLQLLQAGTSSTDTDMELDILIGVPVLKVEVVVVRSGMLYLLGDDLLDPARGRVETY